MEQRGTSAKTVVGLFESVADANRAAEDLFREGFSRDAIGIIAGHELSKPEQYVSGSEDTEGKVVDAVGKGVGLGGGLGAIAGLASSLLFPGVGPLVIGGALATTFLGAGLGGAVGGVMAGLMKAGVDESDARLFEAGLRHGGVVLSVHTDESDARRAVAILDRNGALDMDEHRDRWCDPGADQVEGSADNRVNDTHRDHSNRSNRGHGKELEGVALGENAARLEPWAKHAAILGGGAKPGDFDDEFHRDYQNRFAGTGIGFDRYEPAYGMGLTYARDSRYRDREWSSIEPEIRQHWETHNPDSWNHFSDAVRHGWEKGRRQST